MAQLFGVRSALLSHPVEIEAGTIMLFRQDAAPAGWTRDVASTLDNAALRVMTSGTWVDGKQGATAFDAVFGSSKSSGDYQLLEADIPAHGHADGSLSATSAGSHGHGADLSTGSGTAFTAGEHITTSDPPGIWNAGVSGGSNIEIGIVAGGAHTHPVTGTVADTGGDGVHGHTLSLDLNFVDLILCSKDA